MSRAKQIALILAILLFSGCLAYWFLGRMLTAAAPQPVGTLPRDLNGKSVQFQSDSGSTIKGWFIPGKRGAGAIALMHGVRANRISMLERARFLNKAGYSVLLFDFQAHGESSGKYITFGSLESKDAQAAVQFLLDNVPGEKIGVIGVSMGGAAAILATPPLRIDALVSEMVYPTIDEAVADRLTLRLGSWSRILTPLLLVQLQPQTGVSPDSLRPIDHVGGLTFPKLFIAGTRDGRTTLEESKRLYETASESKEFWAVQGADHEDLHNVARVEYERMILRFFGKHLR